MRKKSDRRLHAILAYVQRASLERRCTSGKEIGEALGMATSTALRYLRVLRTTGHIGFEDGRRNTVHIKEWL